jgi:hypothetical protein
MKIRDRSRRYIRWIPRSGGRSCAKSSPPSLEQSLASFSAPSLGSVRDAVDLGLPSKSHHEWTRSGVQYRIWSRTGGRAYRYIRRCHLGTMAERYEGEASGSRCTMIITSLNDSLDGLAEDHHGH